MMIIIIIIILIIICPLNDLCNVKNIVNQAIIFPKENVKDKKTSIGILSV